ncbi:hypothetical protein [Mycolicibacter heraklionensis]|uniref:hypothetical protein n=1 Tax=Mycolicibacter heraklionensis TaxID=512402 RepID=UPI0023B9D34C|nr:hypothetical protein [Mycolicibacter heraklionensis]
MTGHGDRAGIRRIQPARDVQQGRFAGPRRSGHDDEFSGVDSEVELDKHAHLLVSPVVVLGDSLELQCCRLRITAIAVSAGGTLLTDRRGLGRHRWRISRAMAASSRKKFNGDG